MKISYDWLQSYFNSPLPAPDELAEVITMHSFEVESIDDVNGSKVLDIKVLPNRSHDALSHLGIAREVSALTGISLKDEIIKPKTFQFPESNFARVDTTEESLSPRFSLLVIEGVEVRESPEWMQERLRSIGQKPINNIVDATNYVMFELGQPLHAYDISKLTDDGGVKIGARLATSGENLDTLDGKQFVLNEKNIVIYDGNTPDKKAIGVAGVKGGNASKIDSNTKNILIEAANFNPVKIRTSSKSLGLRTEASVRFENGITPELTIKALQRVASLIIEIASGENTTVEGLADYYPKKANPYKVGVSLSEIQSVLGIDISSAEVEIILKRAGRDWETVKPREKIVEVATILIDVPYKWGSSVTYDSPRSFDCSSFCSYLYAQAGIALPRMAADQYQYGKEIIEEEAQPGDLVFFRGKREGVEVGHNGVYIGNETVIHAGGIDIGYGKVVVEKIKESKYFDTGFLGFRRFDQSDEERYVVTIPDERLDLRIKEDLIEEIGSLYGYENIKAKAIAPYATAVEINKDFYWKQRIREVFLKNGFSEAYTQSFSSAGEVELANPLASDKGYLRSSLSDNLRGVLEENIQNADILNLSSVRIFEIGNVFKANGEHTSLAFAVRNTKSSKDEKEEKFSNQVILELEEILNEKINFIENDGVYETNLNEILMDIKTPDTFSSYEANLDIKYQKFSVFPPVLRDIAIFVPVDTSSDDVVSLIKEYGNILLQSISLFDEFKKEDKISYAYRLVFQSPDKTLTDAEVNEIMANITNSILAKGWIVR